MAPLNQGAPSAPPAPGPTLKERFRQAYSWRQLRFLVAVNTAIAFFSFFASAGDGANLARTAGLSLWVSHIVGHTVYLLCVLSGFFEYWRRWFTVPALLATFVLGGWLGSFLAYLLADLLFGLPFRLGGLTGMLGTHTLVMIVLCFLIWTYAALYDRLQDTAARLAEKEINEERLRRLKDQAELDALRARVNPHFLFNTLNSIASLIPVDAGRAEGMVQRLAHLFRYTLETGRRDTVPLRDELEAVRQYLEIEKVRLGERLQYVIDLEEEAAETPVPGLLVQPLVENSVRHGISPLPGGGRVSISAGRRGDALLLEVRDSGRGLGGGGGQGFGLRSVRERLDLHYGGACRFDLREDSGVVVTMSLPLEAPDASA